MTSSLGQATDVSVKLFQNILTTGALKYAPFKAIHVGAAASTIPEALVNQLASPGRMIIPVENNSDNSQYDYQICFAYSQGSLAGGQRFERNNL